MADPKSETTEEPHGRTYRDPVDVVAEILADGRGAGADGVPRVGRATRKKAQQVLNALRREGWRVLR